MTNPVHNTRELTELDWLQNDVLLIQHSGGSPGGDLDREARSDRLTVLHNKDSSSSSISEEIDILSVSYRILLSLAESDISLGWIIVFVHFWRTF